MPAFWEYPHHPIITHTIDSYQIPSQKKYGNNVSRIVDFFQSESRNLEKFAKNYDFWILL